MEPEKLPKKRIGEILIEEGAIDTDKLEKALKIQKKEGGLIGGILVRQGWVSEENLVTALSKQLSIPFIRLGNYHVNRNALKLVPRGLAEQYLFFPFEQDDRRISIAMADPMNPEALEAIKKTLRSRFQVFLATVSEISEAITTYYRKLSAQS